MSSLHQYWHELVGAAMLGTDRRNPPGVPAGALAEFDLEHPQPTGSQRLLQQVAACVAVQRAGVLPSPPVSPMAPPAGDHRPPTPAAVSDTWRTIVSEWALLEELVRNAGIVLSRDLLSDRVWGQDFGTAASLDVYIGYVRRKTEEGGRPRLIQTVRGIGFVARVEP